MGEEMCETHPEEKLRFLCLLCDRLLCRDCKLTEHEGHKTVDISKAADGLKEKLNGHKERIEQRLAILDHVGRELQEDQETAAKQGKALEKEIQDRVVMVTDWIQQAEAEAMEALRTTNIKIETNFTSTASDLERRRAELTGMLGKVSDASRHLDHPVAALRLEQGMRSGSGSGERLERLTEGLPTYSVRPFLRASRKGLTLDALRMFVGSPVFTQLSKTCPKVVLSPVFRCAGVSGVRVNAVCPMRDGTVWVAHDVHPDDDKEQCVALYSAKGKALRKQTVKGRVSIVRVAHGWVLVSGEHVQKVMNAHETRDVVTERQDEHHVTTTNKGRSLPRQATQPDTYNAFSKLDIRFSVKSTPAGGRFVCTVEARNLPLLWIVCTSSSPISATCTPLAMDADSSGQIFALVDPDLSVKIYRSSYPDPVVRYHPSEDNFSPTDVCFHVLDGKEVLLVADWFSNAVHVLDVTDKFRFLGYLGAGCPLLEQPTSLTKDDDNQLWIGCKGGQLLTCLPADEVQQDSGDEEENGDSSCCENALIHV